MTSQSFDATIGGVVYNVSVSTGGGGVANPTGWYNVKAYGAVGDGVTDDATAIQSAFTAAGAVGGTVFLPAETYSVDSQIALSSSDNVTVIGYGAKLVCGSSTSGAMMAITECDDFTMLGLEFDGNSLAQWGMDFKGCSRLNLKDLYVHRMEDQSAGNYAAGIRVGNNSGVGGDTVNITDCRVYDIYGPTNSAARGIVFYTFSSSGDVYHRDITISGCHIEEVAPVDDGDGIVFQMTNTAGSRLGKSINAVVTGCTFHNCYKRAVKVQNEGVSVTGCTITTDRTGTWGGSSWSGFQYAGISAYENNCVINSNTMLGIGSGAFLSGVETDGSTADLYSISITNNVIVNGTTATGESADPWEQCKGVNVSRSGGSYTIYNTSVSGNSIGYVSYGIWIGYDVDGIAITGNTVYGHDLRALHFFVDGTAIANVSGAGNNFGQGFKQIGLPSSGVTKTSLVLSGDATPESAIAAPVGCLYLRTDGGASTTLYIKESSPTVSTGWVAK